MLLYFPCGWRMQRVLHYILQTSCWNYVWKTTLGRCFHHPRGWNNIPMLFLWWCSFQVMFVSTWRCLFHKTFNCLLQRRAVCFSIVLFVSKSSWLLEHLAVCFNREIYFLSFWFAQFSSVNTKNSNCSRFHCMNVRQLKLAEVSTSCCLFQHHVVSTEGCVILNICKHDGVVGLSFNSNKCRFHCMNDNLMKDLTLVCGMITQMYTKNSHGS